VSDSAQPVPVARLSPRRSRGAMSLWLWVGSFTATVAFLAVFLNIPKDAHVIWHTIVTTALFLMLLLAWPVAHVTGLVLGIQGITRAGDQRGLAIAGTALHGVTILGGLVLIWAGIGVIGVFR
jgi:hypothetical protein